MPIKYWTHISQNSVWLSLTVITQEATRHQTKKRAWMFARICFWNDLLCSSYLPAPLEVRMCEFGFGKLQQSRCDHGTFHPGIRVPHRTVFFTLRRVRRPVGQADGILYREKETPDNAGLRNSHILLTLRLAQSCSSNNPQNLYHSRQYQQLSATQLQKICKYMLKISW